jgi:peptidyl-dipeptidase A
LRSGSAGRHRAGRRTDPNRRHRTPVASDFAVVDGGGGGCPPAIDARDAAALTYTPPSMKTRVRLLRQAGSPLFAASLALGFVACGGGSPPPAVSGAAAGTAGGPSSASAGGASGAEGLPRGGGAGATRGSDPMAFLEQVDRDLRRIWTARDQAAWVNQNFITDDSEALAAAAEEATAEYVTGAIKEAAAFDTRGLPEDAARKLHLLKLAQVVPAPSNADERSELAQIQAQMMSAYGKGKYCPPRLKGKCQTLDELSTILRTSRNYDEQLEAWVGWRMISPPIRERYTRYVALGNKGAREIGFADMGALWRSGYDMAPEAFEADVERLWTEVKPLYDSLHCYVRARLQTKYGKDKVRDKAPIPAHLLGNMWAQEWGNIFDLVAPYQGQPRLDVTPKLAARKMPATEMVRLGERFFTSLGFDPLPKTFWERSLFTRPRDREVVCHASAWDVTWSDDLRIKMCIEPTENDLITIHHELGHNYYFHQYHKLPMLFQAGANDGFHEGIGDTLALSVTPAYLKSIGLLDAVADNPKAAINQQMKMALDKVAFLPFGLLIDKWRWDVFAGKTSPADYNKAWWALRTKYQGIDAPVPRSEADFDPGAKFHVPGSTPYIRYFLARIYQFQFHRALCKVAGHQGSLETCSIYGNKAAGEKLKAMLSLGASRPWPEALAALSGETRADASALLEYFAPLRKWLEEQNKGQQCGW